MSSVVEKKNDTLWSQYQWLLYMKKRKFDSFLKFLKLDEFEYKTKGGFIVESKKVS
jgi:hypothetical protein